MLLLSQACSLRAVPGMSRSCRGPQVAPNAANAMLWATMLETKSLGTVRRLSWQRRRCSLPSRPAASSGAPNQQQPEPPVPPPAPTVPSAPASAHKPSQWERFAGFVQAGDAKEAWLSISASVLQITLPAAVLGLVLHGTLWGGAPPGPVGAAEAAAYSGAAIAAATEVWKILEGFQG